MLATFTAHLVALVGKEHVIAFLKKPTGQAGQGKIGELSPNIPSSKLT